MKKDETDERFEEMLESYTMMPPSASVVRKRKRLRRISDQNVKTKKYDKGENR